MRKHRTIRSEQVAPGATFFFSIETGQFGALLVVWDNTAGAAAPTAIILCPTYLASNPPSPLANFPTVPAAPGAGAVAYAALGLNSAGAFPMPDMVTVGVVNAATSAVTITVEGDEFIDSIPNPFATMEKNRV